MNATVDGHPAILHFVELEHRRSRYRSYSLCGELVDASETSDQPTCPDCRAILDPGLTADQMFGAEPPGTPVRSTLGNPLAGYKERTR